MITTLDNTLTTLTYTTPLHTLATSADARDPMDSVASIMPDGSHRTGFHCATNGKALAIVPFQLDEGHHDLHYAGFPASIRCIPGKVIKGIKAVKGTRTLDTCRDGSSTGSDGTAHGGSPNRFPPVSKVLDALKDCKERVVISFNAKLLYELALALGSDGAVSLHCDPKGIKASIVVPLHGSVGGAVGVLMPIQNHTARSSTANELYEIANITSRFAAVGH
jgi:hypothetical protein